MDDNSIHKYEPLWGDWNVDEEVGRGSFGTVYKITREDMGYAYTSAVKLITVPNDEQYREAESSIGDDEATLSVYFEDIVKNIVREINLLNTLSDNTNILGYKDHRIIKREDRIGWDILIRMEYVTSLRKYLKQNPLSRADVIRLGVDICTALELCSKKGIINRDIKDDNIFINDDGAFKLGDFGIARQLTETSKTATRKTGTLLYMAPEVYRGEKYDSQVDIYSLGIVMYRLLNNGRMPLIPRDKKVVLKSDSDDAFERRMQGEQLPAPALAGGRLAQTVCKACAYRTVDRYSTPEEMRNDLLQALRELSKEEKEQTVVSPNTKTAVHNLTENSLPTPRGTVSKYDGIANSDELSASDLPDEDQPINKTMSMFNGLGNVTEEKQLEEMSYFSDNKNTASNLQSQEGPIETEQLNQIVPETNRLSSIVPEQTVEPSSAVDFDKGNNFERKQNRKWYFLTLFVSILIVGMFIGLSLNNQRSHASESDILTNIAETAITNTYGNSSGNTSNRGIAAQQSDWIYYSNYSDGASIYKIRTDGTEKTQLNYQSSSYINVVDDWIYYKNDDYYGCIYKIRTDGTERTQLNSKYSSYINIVGNWIYYNANNNDGMYKIRTDGTGETQLNFELSSYINVVGDWIYYSNYSDGASIYKIRTDGTEKTQLNSERSLYINVVGDWIYYSDALGYLCKIRTDGTKRTQLNYEHSSSINVVGDWIYYVANNDGIYKMRIDGTEKTKLNSDNSVYINVIGDWIYYSNTSDGSYIYKIRTDGTNPQKVE